MTLPFFSRAARLVIVAGHAVYTGAASSDPARDENWCLLDYQKGEPPFYLEHIRRGVEMTAADERTLLVFSGGQTRPAAGPRSEAQGYWLAAEHCRWWGAAVADRCTTEEFARDSFENLLFSVCRFHECTNRWPERVSVIGWAFKARRFDLHRRALRYPRGRFAYEGANDPADAEEVAAAGEPAALRHFERDPYAASSAPLGEKRSRRNPYARRHPYETSCPALAALLRHRGPELYEGPLPWDEI